MTAEEIKIVENKISELKKEMQDVHGSKCEVYSFFDKRAFKQSQICIYITNASAFVNDKAVNHFVFSTIRIHGLSRF